MGNLFSSSDICTPSSQPYDPVGGNLPSRPSQEITNADSQQSQSQQRREEDNTELLDDIVRECSRRMVRVQDAGVKDFEGVMGEVVWMETVKEPSGEGGEKAATPRKGACAVPS